jgi:hypothetical protein
MMYTVQSVSPRNDKTTGKQYTDNYGNLGWYVTLQDPEGGVHSVSYKTKHSPAVGEELDGELVAKEWQGKTYYDFKKAKKEFTPQAGREVNTKTMYLAYAKDIVVALIQTGEKIDNPEVRATIYADVFVDWDQGKKPVSVILPPKREEIHADDIPF